MKLIVKENTFQLEMYWKTSLMFGKGNVGDGNIRGETSHFQAPTMVETGFYDCPGPVSCQ